MTGTGSPNVFTTTDAPGATAGQYTLTGFGSGSYTVSLSKDNGQNGITSNDAARIAQHVAGISPLTNDVQKVTADVSDNGSISSNDAALIGRYIVGIINNPPSNINLWKFFVAPGPTFPVGSSPTTRNYGTVTGNLTGQDFVGLLIGDVTGNWAPSAAKPLAAKQKLSPVTIGLAQIVASNKDVTVPVTIQGAAKKGIISYEFDLRYDPNVIEPQADAVDLAGTASRGLFSVTNVVEPGLLRVVLYGALPIDNDGVLLNLKFSAVGAPGTVSPLVFERMMFNEGDPGTIATDGAVELSASAPNQTELTGRVVNTMGEGIPNSRVILTDTTGVTRFAVSNGFGYYRFGDLQLGQTYTVSVESRGWTFAPMMTSVANADLSLDMIAEP